MGGEGTVVGDCIEKKIPCSFIGKSACVDVVGGLVDVMGACVVVVVYVVVEVVVVVGEVVEGGGGGGVVVGEGKPEERKMGGEQVCGKECVMMVMTSGGEREQICQSNE